MTAPLSTREPRVVLDTLTASGVGPDEVERLSFNAPNPSSVPSSVSGMAEDAATEADGPEQEREYEQLQAEQARGRKSQERLSLREVA